MVDVYSAYYLSQAEGSGIGGVYKNTRNQKGDGLGNWFSGIYRAILPYFKSSAKAVGSEALSTGVNLLRDVIQGKSMKDSVQSRITEAGSNLTRKAANSMSAMVGGGKRRGYKKRNKRARSQSQRRVKRRRTSKNKLQKKRITKKRKYKKGKKNISFKDIFG